MQYQNHFILTLCGLTEVMRLLLTVSVTAIETAYLMGGPVGYLVLWWSLLCTAANS